MLKYDVSWPKHLVHVALSRSLAISDSYRRNPLKTGWRGCRRRQLANVVSRFPRLLAQDQQRLCALPWSQFTDIRLQPPDRAGFGWKSPLARVLASTAARPC